MAFERLVNNAEFRRIAPSSGAPTTFTLAAGTSDVSSSAIDARGYNELTLIALVGAIASTGTLAITVEGSDDGTNWSSALASQSYADDDDDKMLIVNLRDLAYRYYRMSFDRGTANSTIDGLIAILGAPVLAAVAQGSTVKATKVVAAGS